MSTKVSHHHTSYAKRSRCGGAFSRYAHPDPARCVHRRRSCDNLPGLDDGCLEGSSSSELQLGSSRCPACLRRTADCQSDRHKNVAFCPVAAPAAVYGLPESWLSFTTLPLPIASSDVCGRSAHGSWTSGGWLVSIIFHGGVASSMLAPALASFVVS